jgi:hypothetical protein
MMPIYIDPDTAVALMFTFFGIFAIVMMLGVLRNINRHDKT